METDTKPLVYHADDDEFIRRAINSVFGRFFGNALLEQFEDGTSLERRIKEKQPNFVMTDHNMPGKKGGIIALQYAPLLRVPFLVLSSPTSQEDIELMEQIKNTPYCGYLEKPFLPTELEAYIREHSGFFNP